jgi:type IV secretion system protein VirD4
VFVPILHAQSPVPSGASFDVGFSPSGNSVAVVEKAIVAAKTAILMACYEFTSRDIAEDLENAAHRGVKVRIVAD